MTLEAFIAREGRRHTSEPDLCEPINHLRAFYMRGERRHAMLTVLIILIVLAVVIPMLGIPLDPMIMRIVGVIVLIMLLFWLFSALGSPLAFR